MLRSINKLGNGTTIPNRGFITVFQHYKEAYERFGWRETLWKMYNPGNVKFGKLVGTDRYGNKYYEDPTEVHGQQRWCEYQVNTYKDYDGSQVPPEWHMWMHMVTDDVPGEQKMKTCVPSVATKSHAIYKDHLGPVDPNAYGENLTGAKSRGYKVGSLVTDPEERDYPYVQPNHAANNRRRDIVLEKNDHEFPLRPFSKI